MRYTDDHFDDDAPSEPAIDTLMLDEATAERLLEQQESSVPPGYAKVARLLSLASAPALREELADEERAIVAFVSALAARPLVARSHRRGRWAASGLASVILLSGGVAAAATGSLPGPAQDAIAKALDHVGVDVPMSNGESVSHGSTGKAATDGSSSTPTDTKATGIDNGAGNGGVNQGGAGNHTGVTDHTKTTGADNGTGTGAGNPSGTGTGNGGTNQGGTGNHTGVTNVHPTPTQPPKSRTNIRVP